MSAYSLEFLRALNAAVEDVRLERQGRVPTSFFFDPDVFIGAFRDIGEMWTALIAQQSGKQVDPVLIHRITFRTLWAMGFGCKAGVLWPHASEINRVLNASFEPGTKDQDALRVAVGYAQRTFTPERVQSLITLLNSREPDSFLQAAAMLPPAYLALAIASLPSWDVRLGLTGDRFVVPEPVDREVVDEFKRVAGARVADLSVRLQRARSGMVGQLLITFRLRSLSITDNTARDASSLVLLEREFSSDKGVRFVTETERLIKVIEDSPDLFPWSIRQGEFGASVLDNPQSPLRSNLYMLIRMAIPSLAFVDRREKLSFPDASQVSFDDFDRFLAQAREIIRSKQTFRFGEGGPSLAAGEICELFLERLLLTSGFVSTWCQKESPSLAYLVKNLKQLPSFKDTVQQTKQSRELSLDRMRQWKATQFAEIDRVLRVQPAEQPAPKPTDTSKDKIAAALRFGASKWLRLLYPRQDSQAALAESVNQDLLVAVEQSEVKDLDRVTRARVVAYVLEFLDPESTPQDPAEWIETVYQVDARFVVECVLGILSFTDSPTHLADEAMWTRCAAWTDDEAKFCAAYMLAWRAFHWCDRIVTRDAAQLDSAPIRSAAMSAQSNLKHRLRNLNLAGEVPELRALLFADVVETLLDLYAGVAVHAEKGRFDFSEVHSYDAWAWSSILRRDGAADKEFQVGNDRFKSIPFVERYIVAHRKRYQR